MSILKNIFIVILILTYNLLAEENDCHLLEIKDDKIYKVCDSVKTEVKFNYKTHLYRILDDYSKNKIAILLRNEYESELRDENYFILDYKNMLIFDNQCLNSNSLYLDIETGQLEKRDFSKDDYHPFKLMEYIHCQEKLEKWVDILITE